ncbi:LysM peptidoglycan-binding domain-containing protein [uncultured Roseobacter sp.]|uniref:LysM peptidoglycan-binding domain-containing protein n=1 Tax=uncultured Roseobacter sp. TaxID=114847 RepID=UPI00261E3F76|nr:LysM peptidoglycan-binding domain-containing protein [uncultured Roseobacter sp.]
MSDKGGATGQAGSGLLTAGIVIAVVIAAGTYLGLRDDAEPTQEDLAALVAPGSESQPAAGESGAVNATGDAGGTTEASQPAASQEAVSESAEEVASGLAEEPARAVLPSVDEVRVDAGGLMVIAGRAAPGETVRILIDGTEIATATADSQGSFAAVATLGPSDAARVLTLETGEGADVVASAADVILAPVAVPVDVAEAPSERETPDETPAPRDQTSVEDAAQTVADAAGELVEDVTTGVAQAGEQIAGTVAKAEEAVADLVAGLQSGTAQPADQPDPPAITGTPETPAENNAPMPEVVAENNTATQTDDTVAADAQSDPQTAETGASNDAPAGAPVTAAVPVEDDAVEEVAAAAAPASSEPSGSGASVENDAVTATAETADTGDAPAQQQIAVLQSTEEGVELLDTAPAAPRTVRLDTIGYSDTGVVQLAGRAGVDASSVRVYLDNAPRVTLLTDDDGAWRGEVPDVAPGVYTLRIDALDAAGDVTSRLETPFKREAPEVLAEATDGQTGPVSAVTVQTGDTLWAIARDRYGEGLLYVRVFEANRSSIRDPDLIYPGQIFDLPEDG